MTDNKNLESKPKSDLKVRVISAICMLPLFLVLYFGGWPLKIVIAIAVCLGVQEMENGMERAGIILPRKAIDFLVVICLVAAVMEFDFRFYMAWFFVAVVVAFLHGFKVNERKLSDVMGTLFVTVYPVFLFIHLIFIDRSGYSFAKWHCFLISIGTDMTAYFVGRAIGKKKLCPNLSPKKSVEGAVGGLVGSVVFMAIFNFGAMKLVPAAFMPWWVIITIALVGSVFAQLGDLAASALKRQMGIKDYGKLIPGHGGIMDRFDSVIFVAPVLYYIIVLLESGAISLA